MSPKNTLETPLLITASMPAVAIAAPTMLEIRAWLEDVGRPKYHVIRSHIMADRRAEITVICVMLPVSTIPAPTVFATAVPDRAPKRLRIAAIVTAVRGDRTLVDTDVAMALAVS